MKALREGQAVAPAGEDGRPSIAVRATDYASWVLDSPAYEVTYEEVCTLTDTYSVYWPLSLSPSHANEVPTRRSATLCQRL